MAFVTVTRTPPCALCALVHPVCPAVRGGDAEDSFRGFHWAPVCRAARSGDSQQASLGGFGGGALLRLPRTADGPSGRSQRSLPAALGEWFTKSLKVSGGCVWLSLLHSQQILAAETPC